MTTSKDIKFYERLKISKSAPGEIEIQAEVPADIFDDVFEGVIESALQDFEAPGFRKGKAPRDLFLQYANQAHLLEETASEALRIAYPQILIDEKIEAVSHPQISITKLALKNPMAFTAKVAIIPDIRLPDYKKIAKNVYSKDHPLPVTKEELNDVLKKFLALQNKSEGGAEEIKGDPEELLTNDFVKTLGPFVDVKGFINQVKKDLTIGKKSSWLKERREAFAKELLQATSLSLSPLLLDEEWERHQKLIEEELKRANTTLETYAKQGGISVDDFLAREKEGIQKQMTLKYILRAIALQESITPAQEDIAQELETLSRRYPDIDPVKAQGFIEESLRNEKVLRFLEEEGGVPKESSSSDEANQAKVDEGSGTDQENQKDQED
ncbi:MAG: hypothetical protein KGZ30_02100 [Anaplasmataceae bacterium]|nr:hypothetical protein [Anaplasmataceae bacterium]